MEEYEGKTEEALNDCRACLLKRKEQLSLAESCTGGWISKWITDQPGSSAYYWGGVCSYANEAKQKLLGVPKEHLQTFGAVSAEVARDMAEGIRRLSGTEWSVSVTGIAGPDGGSSEKPVGLVYIAAAGTQETAVKRYLFQGNREQVRQQTVEQAFCLLREQMSLREKTKIE